jgi:hypothetical protein
MTSNTGWDYNENDVRYATADGLTRTGYEEWWEQEVDQFDRLGIPDELVQAAKPAPERNEKEQAYARKFLMERQRTHHVHPGDLLRLEKVVKDRGYTVRPAEEHTDDEFLQAWDEHTLWPGAGQAWR